MLNWLPPFVYLAFVLGVCLFGPEERRPELQARVKNDINYYLSVALVVIVFSILASMTYRSYFMAAVAWIAAVVAIFISQRRLFAPTEPPPPEAF